MEKEEVEECQVSYLRASSERDVRTPNLSGLSLPLLKNSLKFLFFVSKIRPSVCPFDAAAAAAAVGDILLLWNGFQGVGSANNARL